ncbi:hypothetical protein NHX12_025399 [Muraenolepis orangiensis]|uniref:WKF domain-containing protein n=1 Tax=Muraenolepis orangiensis TaxID=630683 RepID=A0A9Q0ITB4_9TELE|nr:hypothetical protein NHX12_025399 [Muraenolepis orangiensis]
MAKGKSVESNGTEGLGSEEMEAVKRKNNNEEEGEEEQSKKMKIQEEAEQEVPEVVVKQKKKKNKHKKKKKNPSTEDARTAKAQPESTETPHPAVAPEQDEDGKELSVEEQRVLQRKLKKLRKKEAKAKLRAEGKTVEKVVPATPQAGQNALDYLTCWNDNRTAWKFQKVRQTWLLQQMFDSEKISDEIFPALLSYIEGLRGAAKDTTVEKAEALVKSFGDGPWAKEDEHKMHRAREVIQLLS